MVEVENQPIFEKKIQKIKDAALKERVKKQGRRSSTTPKSASQ